jgi:hypothetical protein
MTGKEIVESLKKLRPMKSSGGVKNKGFVGMCLAYTLTCVSIMADTKICKMKCFSIYEGWQGITREVEKKKPKKSCAENNEQTVHDDLAEFLKRFLW